MLLPGEYKSILEVSEKLMKPLVEKYKLTDAERDFLTPVIIPRNTMSELTVWVYDEVLKGKLINVQFVKHAYVLPHKTGDYYVLSLGLLNADLKTLRRLGGNPPVSFEPTFHIPSIVNEIRIGRDKDCTKIKGELMLPVSGTILYHKVKYL